MPQEYITYCVVETTFILSDSRYKRLLPAAKVLYLALWALAFQTRREILPVYSSDTTALREASSLDTRTIKKCVTSLQQVCLIEVLPDGRIKVNGVKGKGNIRWKVEEPERENTPREESLKLHTKSPLAETASSSREELKEKEVAVAVTADDKTATDSSPPEGAAACLLPKHQRLVQGLADFGGGKREDSMMLLSAIGLSNQEAVSLSRDHKPHEIIAAVRLALKRKADNPPGMVIDALQGGWT